MGTDLNLLIGPFAADPPDPRSTLVFLTQPTLITVHRRSTLRCSELVSASPGLFVGVHIFIYGNFVC